MKDKKLRKIKEECGKGEGCPACIFRKPSGIFKRGQSIDCGAKNLNQNQLDTFPHKWDLPTLTEEKVEDKEKERGIQIIRQCCIKAAAAAFQGTSASENIICEYASIFESYVLTGQVPVGEEVPI